jgi:uncharacterized membrane protein
MQESYISKKPVKRGEAISFSEIRESVAGLIRKEFPEISESDIISIEELNFYRRQYLSKLVEQEKGELRLLNEDVVDAIRNNSILSETIRDTDDPALTPGQKAADKIASFGGSWTFIIVFFSFLILWMILNFIFLSNRGFDPYPFILLNLILSCIAAIQAPIIMMSQNRQEQKDRMRAEHDYKVNLKAELEIKLLSEKIDHVLIHQNKKLLDIQEVQIDYLEDLMKQLKLRAVEGER